MAPLKFLENIVILCFERRFSKQNSVIRLKSNIFAPPQSFGLATPLCARCAISANGNLFSWLLALSRTVEVKYELKWKQTSANKQNKSNHQKFSVVTEIFSQKFCFSSFPYLLTLSKKQKLWNCVTNPDKTSCWVKTWHVYGTYVATCLICDQ